MITPQILMTVTDHIVRQHKALIGCQESGHGIGGGKNVEDDWGFSLHSRNLLSYVMSTNDYDVFEALGPSAKGVVNMANSTNLYGAQLQGLIQRVDLLCRNAGLPGAIDYAGFATYYNTGAGGPYNCLLSPQYSVLYGMFVSARKFMAVNSYAPACDFTLESVDSTKYAGCQSPMANIANPVYADSGGRKLVVTGVARTSTGDLEDDHLWTAALSTGGSTFQLVPNNPGDLMISVSKVRLPAFLKSGLVTVTGPQPAGRP